WHSCRFACTFTYSEEGEYRQSHWIVCNDESGLISRMYFDTDGDGILDRMDTFEKGIHTLYKMNGLFWEKQEERPYTKLMKKYAEEALRRRSAAAPQTEKKRNEKQ
ncbi:MAG: hypothetical protein LBH00_05825, partial [Planctomycetaceae bacterium]|nr:hypothetical protein [Planctomycetaceae bacterium]